MIEAPENVLIIGSGAREHALGWKIRQGSSHVRLDFAPGNGGTAQIGTNRDIGFTDIDRMVNFAVDNGSFVVVGPERPLAMGLVNALSEAGVSAFGPTQETAQLESSKAFAVDFMDRYDIPHPETEVFDDPLEAEAFIRGYPSADDFVIKADGLAEGKAVILPRSQEEAISTIRRMMVDREFKEAGERILIQQRLYGTEVSAIALVSNEVELLPLARDYKPAYDGDEGPNTGGMGAYSPSEYVSQQQLMDIYYSILLPAKMGMIQDGMPFKGALYAGIMMTDDGPKVLEFNVRFGDPETQVQVRRIKSNLLHLLQSTARGRLIEDQVKVSNDHAVGVVIASGGYPGNYEKGKRIGGIDQTPDGVVVFQAGTSIQDGELKTSGGRVLTVTATGPTKAEARQKVYTAIGERGEEEGIWVEGGFNRGDIALG